MILGFLMFVVYGVLFTAIVGWKNPMASLAAFWTIYFLTNLIHSFLTEEIPE